MVDVEFTEFIGGGTGCLEGILESVCCVGVCTKQRVEEAVEEGMAGVVCAEDANGADGNGKGGVFVNLMALALLFWNVSRMSCTKACNLC